MTTRNCVRCEVLHKVWPENCRWLQKLQKSHVEITWPTWESQKPLQNRWGLLRGHGVKGQSKGPFSEAFVTFVRVPVGNTYRTLNFLGCRKKSVFLRSSSKCWHLGMSGEKNVECVKSIFQRHFSLYLSRTKETTGYPVSEAPAQKIKNASCLHLYEVLYRNRPHPSAPPVLSKMVLE